jgi:hypothetical protein
MAYVACQNFSSGVKVVSRKLRRDSFRNGSRKQDILNINSFIEGYKSIFFVTASKLYYKIQFIPYRKHMHLNYKENLS